MERLPISGKRSSKCIPPPKLKEYKKKLISQTEKFERNLTWKMIHTPGAIEHPTQKTESQEDEEILLEDFRTFGFKSINKPRPVPELAPFFEDVWKLVKSVKQRPVKNKFLNELSKDIKSLPPKKVVVAADKSRNLYTCSKETYVKKLEENVTKEYKKAEINETDIVNLRSAEIAKDLNLEKRMHVYTTSEAFITFKDHKDECTSRPTFRLINPAKTDIGKVGKQLLEENIFKLKEKLNVQQWRSTQDVINWFKEIKNKKTKVFYKFDIKSYYPSITKDLLKKALALASEISQPISKKDLEIIFHSCESFLFFKDEAWVKKGENGRFDVPMGSYNGAEISELCGLYILHKLTSGKTPIFQKDQVGLYRDDGLAHIPEKGSKRDLNKRVRKVFSEIGLEITTDFGLKSTDFLDVDFNLEKDEYSPYRKPNDEPVYIDINSDHPPIIKKNLKNMIQKRLSTLSSSEEVFNRKKSSYETALKNAGHQHNLEYVSTKTTQEKPKRKRKKKILYYNPPYSVTIITDIGKQFFRLMEKHFPVGAPLRKHINKNKVKFSYSTCANMKSHISKHNAKVLRKEETKKGNVCKCVGKYGKCPIPGKCNLKSVVYKADVQNPITNEVKSYIGLTKNEFIKRFDQHRYAMNRRISTHATTLSKHVWKIKDETGIEPKIDWSIKARAFSFSSGSRQCDLCLSEKLEILQAEKSSSLNKRDELLYMCRHKIPFRLEKFKPKLKTPAVT